MTRCDRGKDGVKNRNPTHWAVGNALVNPS